jgi:NTP pyrophosphatase (non-canonical NTP hydrolase)
MVQMHIREFQELMRSLYFHRDSDRGVIGTYEWLVDEVKELGEALHSNNLKEAEKEFADVIAWLASLANVTGIDLERAALEKYPGTCPKCGHIPCQCTF